MTTITLYTKDGCTLCDIVKDHLATREAAYPHQLVEVDITKDHDTFMRYRYIIPVVEIGDVTLKAPISRGQVDAALIKLRQG